MTWDWLSFCICVCMWPFTHLTDTFFSCAFLIDSFFYFILFCSTSENTLWIWVSWLAFFFFFTFFGHDKFFISFNNLFERIGYIHWLIRNDKRYEEIDRIFVPLLQKCTALKTPLMTKILANIIADITPRDSRNGISFIDKFLRYLY